MAARATVATRIPYSGSWRSRLSVLARERSRAGARTAVSGRGAHAGSLRVALAASGARGAADGLDEGAAPGRVVLEHVERRRGRAEQHGRDGAVGRAGEREAGGGVGGGDGLVQGRGARGAGAGRPRGTGPRASGPLSPIRTAADARPPRPPARARARSTPLSRPPAISTTGAGKARSAAITASGWVPWESLTNRTPSTRPTRLEPVLDAR